MGFLLDQLDLVPICPSPCNQTNIVIDLFGIDIIGSRDQGVHLGEEFHFFL